MSQTVAAQTKTENKRSAEKKRHHSSEENGDSNDAITLKSQKLDNNEAEAIIDVPKCKKKNLINLINFFYSKSQ